MPDEDVITQRHVVEEQRKHRARVIASAGGIANAIRSGALPQYIDTTVSETIVLGLMLQEVNVFIGVLGHGSTEVGEVLRIYQEAGLVKVVGVRSEVEASHAAASLRWISKEKAAVFTSIGPGSLHALAASLMPASNGLGIWYLLGDETTEDEGYNMQQIPRPHQAQYLKLFSQMGEAYSVHTPRSVPTALKRGLITTSHPYQAGPFFLLLPMNVQPIQIDNFNIREFPYGNPPRLPAAFSLEDYQKAVALIQQSRKIVIKVGGGGRYLGDELEKFLELADAVVVSTPIASGAVPASNKRNMMVGGSKGSICGNYAMDEADLLVAIGTRFVCQSDCSRTGFPKVKAVININSDVNNAMHYADTIALVGDGRLTLEKLNAELSHREKKKSTTNSKSSAWLSACNLKRQEWQEFKQARYDQPVLFDPVWGREVLTQPAAIFTALEWAKRNNVPAIFDAGDVQANGFQIAEDEYPGQTYTDSGASYMGFAVSALLATGLSQTPFYAVAVTGDGSFTMNPQILIDGVEHKARGCILLLDNRRMSAISGLQMDQYGKDFATNDSVQVDYVQWAKSIHGIHAVSGGYSVKDMLDALQSAFKHPGLSLIHVPVYYGTDPLGGLGVYGRWNVGNWSSEVQKMRHQIGL